MIGPVQICKKLLGPHSALNNRTQTLFSTSSNPGAPFSAAPHIFSQITGIPFLCWRGEGLAFFFSADLFFAWAFFATHFSSSQTTSFSRPSHQPCQRAFFVGHINRHNAYVLSFLRELPGAPMGVPGRKPRDWGLELHLLTFPRRAAPKIDPNEIKIMYGPPSPCLPAKKSSLPSSFANTASIQRLRSRARLGYEMLTLV